MRNPILKAVIFAISLWLFLVPPVFAGIMPGKKGTILVFVASHCPCTDPHRLMIRQLFEEHQKKDVAFYAIFSNKGENRELTSRFMKQTGWDFVTQIDRDGGIQKKYDAHITPEAILLNAKGEVVYRGAIDDSVPNMGQTKNPYLKTALEQLLAGRPVDPKNTAPYGCYIVR